MRRGKRVSHTDTHYTSQPVLWLPSKDQNSHETHTSPRCRLQGSKQSKRVLGLAEHSGSGELDGLTAAVAAAPGVCKRTDDSTVPALEARKEGQQGESQQHTTLQVSARSRPFTRIGHSHETHTSPRRRLQDSHTHANKHIRP